MVDKKSKKSKSHRKSSHSSRSSGSNHQGGEIPRDPALDQTKYYALHEGIRLRNYLNLMFRDVVFRLATRKRANETFEDVYSILINDNFQRIRGRWDTANVARERRGVRTRDFQMQEIRWEDRLYQDWNHALAIQGEIAAMPPSFQHFSADEMAMVLEIAKTRSRGVKDIKRQAVGLWVWLKLSEAEVGGVRSEEGKAYFENLQQPPMLLHPLDVPVEYESIGPDFTKKPTPPPKSRPMPAWLVAKLSTLESDEAESAESESAESESAESESAESESAESESAESEGGESDPGQA